MATTSAATIDASASRSGVSTVPWRTGRWAVASYSSIVITLRASTRNSSGAVLLSRNPARLSATSGGRLTVSGISVFGDQSAQRVHSHLQHPVHVRGLEVMDLARAQP